MPNLLSSSMIGLSALQRQLADAECYSPWTLLQFSLPHTSELPAGKTVNWSSGSEQEPSRRSQRKNYLRRRWRRRRLRISQRTIANRGYFLRCTVFHDRYWDSVFGSSKPMHRAMFRLTRAIEFCSPSIDFKIIGSRPIFDFTYKQLPLPGQLITTQYPLTLQFQRRQAKSVDK